MIESRFGDLPRQRNEGISPGFWRYAVAEGVAELSPVAGAAHDPTVDEPAVVLRYG